LRGTLPRLRYDQFMKFGWKVLIPASLFWIMIVATMRVMSLRGTSRAGVLGFAVGVVLVVLIGSFIFDASKKRAIPGEQLDIPAPSFPVPSIPVLDGSVSQSEVSRG